MEFTKEQRALIKSENPKVSFELKDFEVLAIFSLGQMNGKVVRLTDNFWGNTKNGVFTIDHLNGNKDLDFSNPDNWTNVHIESIAVTLTSPNDFGGEDTTTFQSLLDIKSIALLK